MKTIMKAKTMRNKDSHRASLRHRITAGFLAIFMLFQILLPAVAAAFTIGDEKLTKLLAADLQFERSSSSDYQYQKASYLGAEIPIQISSLETFHNRLVAAKIALPSPSYVPIAGDITIFVPHYPIGKMLGDVYVQSRMIRAQINEMLGRHLIDPARFATELLQSNGLYEAAFVFAQNTPAAIFGQQPPEGTNLDMIWPEYRTINNERVLVPVVYLKAETIQQRAVKGVTNQFDGDAVFKDVEIAKGSLLEQRSGFLAAMRNLNNNGGTIYSADSLNILVGGTLSNLSGKITAEQNLNITAGQIINKTVVVPYKLRNGSATRLGEIATINAITGNLTLRSYSDIIFEGGVATAGGGITFQADRNIILKSVYTESNTTTRRGDWKYTNSSVDVAAQSKLTANETIKLIADGVIQVSGAELISTRGGIELLASQGIHVLDELSQEQILGVDRKGKTRGQSSEFRTEAVRAALKAGKGVLLDTEFGDVTLKAANIETVDGTQVTARNGKVNMLMTKELEEFHLQTVRKSTWTVKTRSVDVIDENNLSNIIIGGFDVHAANGINVEYTQTNDLPKQPKPLPRVFKSLFGSGIAGNALYRIGMEYKGVEETEEATLARQIDKYRNMPGMEWMAQVYDQPWIDKHTDPNVPSVVGSSVNWTAVEEIHKEIRKSNTSLSPAAMAIIAIAVAVAMGPGGAGLLGSGSGAIGITTAGTMTTTAAVMQAGVLTLATQAAQSLAAGNNLDETLNAMDSDESLKSLAISMATAGAMSAMNVGDLELFKVPSEEAYSFASFANQAYKAVASATVSAGISVTINGGNSDDYLNSFKTSVASYAISTIGEKLANKIGAAAKIEDPVLRMGVAAKYISHAALGCMTGALTSELNDVDRKVGCSSGAGGAVIAEYVGSLYADRLDSDLQEWIKENTDPNGNLPTRAEQTAQFNNLKAAGVDMARLAAALTAFGTGGDVDIAADAGQNAAQNNALNLAFTLYEYLKLNGDGDWYKGLQAVGAREDLLTVMYDSLIGKVDEFGREVYSLTAANFPEEVELLSLVLTRVYEDSLLGEAEAATAQLLTAGIQILVEDENGQKVLKAWNSLSVADQNALKGGGRIFEIVLDVAARGRVNAIKNMIDLPEVKSGELNMSAMLRDRDHPDWNRIDEDTKQVLLAAPDYKAPPEYRITKNQNGSATITGPRGGAYHSTGMYTEDGTPIFVTESGSYYAVSESGTAKVRSPFNYAEAVVIKDPSEAWLLVPTERGKAIEKYLADNEYSDWYNVGQEQNGYFKLVDFQKDNTLISLKTVDTNGKSWGGDMKEHIDNLSRARSSTVDNVTANMVLDIRVQPGGLAAAQSLINYGVSRGISVTIKEF